jgi:hypothetical protein
VTTLAARIPDRLYRRLAKLDDQSVPIAETYRRVAVEAERLGLTRPSYERIRVLVHQSRRWRRAQGPTTSSVVVDVAFQLRPAGAILDQLAGTAVRTFPR